MTKRETGADRRERLAAVQREQKAAQRRRNLVTAGVGIAIGVLIIGGTAVFIAKQQSNKPENKALSSFGVSAAAANCSDVIESKAAISGDHVGPGTNKPNETHVNYTTVPPVSGPHFPVPLPSSRNFYTVADAPVVEQLVHNLEHGYNIVWYDKALDASQVAELKGLSVKLAAEIPGNKFIVAPWDDTRGTFPDNKQIAISHWGKTTGFRQYCGQVSGEAIGKFVQDHPYTDSPEPNAA